MIEIKFINHVPYLQSMNHPKVLVGCPTYDGGEYCINRFIERVKELTYPNYDILIVDNSEGDQYSKKIRDKGICVIKGPRFDMSVKTITNSRNMIINFAIKNGYDYLLNMDHDVIPPKNIIEELMSCDKDIVSGIYFGYYRSGGKLKVLPVAYRGINEEEFEKMKKMGLPDFIKSHDDLKRNLTEEEAQGEKILEVKIPSNGCMLLKKCVFEKVNYDLLNFPDLNKTSDDIHFAESAKRNGFKLYVYTKVKCKHLIIRDKGL